jgi:hypothetical protein
MPQFRLLEWQVYGYYQNILYNIMWWSLSLTYVKFVSDFSMSVVFFSYSIQHFVKFVCDLQQVYGFYLSILCIMWSSLSVTYGRSVILSRYSIQHHVIKFVGDRRQVSGILYETFCEVCQWLVACQWYSLGNLYNIMWSSLSVTCGRSMVFSSYSIQHHVMKFVSDLW